MPNSGDYVNALRRVFDRRAARKRALTEPIRILGVMGSSRQDGNTAALMGAVFQNLNDARWIDLSDYSIAPYAYDHRFADDDFLPIAKIMREAEIIVYASPVYWYSMSAQLKAFFDRLTDLTEGEAKAIGKALAGKKTFVISTGGASDAPASFERPFSDTARYFDMSWGGLFYAAMQSSALSPETKRAAEAFARQIASAPAAPAVKAA